MTKVCNICGMLAENYITACNNCGSFDFKESTNEKSRKTKSKYRKSKYENKGYA